MWRSSTLVSLLSVRACAGALFERVEDLPTSTYDFVVVGGGTAGSVIANRLSENPNHSVLVLEAGGSHENNLLTMVPGLAGNLMGSQWDWNDTVQLGLSDRTFTPYSRGFVLGGSSTINGMAYTRGSSEDWDRYARVTGDSGWSWEAIQPYLRKNERFTGPSDGHDTTGEFDPSVHGFDGINSVSLSGFRRELEVRVINASKASDDEFGFNLDMNSGNQLGIGYGQWTVFNGTRSSAATSYLAPGFVQRPNLHVLLHAHATKLLSNELAFQVVEFSQDAGQNLHEVIARKEIILSAGAVGTPQLLMLSGIGDEDTLASFGINTIHHLPAVGRNLTDQPVVISTWSVNTTDTDDTAGRNATLAAEQLKQWKDSRSGPLVNAAILVFGWLRVKDSGILERFEDPAAGPNTAHWELPFLNGLVGATAPTGNFISANPILVSPASRDGFVALSSSSPFDHPVINVNLLSSEFDVAALREALRRVDRFLASSLFDGFIIASNLNATTDEELDTYIRNTALPTIHPVGSASMSAKDASWGVVDPDLRVKGVRGLRVVDASILPFVPAGHTQVPVYVVAERAADLIKDAWKDDVVSG